MSEIIVRSSEDILSLRASLDSHYKLDRAEADSWVVSLDKNPTNKSPEQLYLKLYELQEYLNRASAAYTKYMRFYIASANIVTDITSEYERNLNITFANHVEELRQFRSTEEKTRYCVGLMDQEIVKKKEQADIFFKEVRGYYSFFKAKHGFLASINGNILTQLGILKLMYSMNGIPSPIDYKEKENLEDIDSSDNSFIDGTASF